MNGAQSLVRMLIASDVDLCLGKPGTSKVQVVAALDKADGTGGVLGSFQGVVTGAADGAFRMAERAAATLLHPVHRADQWPGRTAQREADPLGHLDIVGEHASHPLAHDAPLASDIAGVARPMSDRVKTCASSNNVAADDAQAFEVARTPSGRIATLILPADTAWNLALRVHQAQALAPRGSLGQ